MSKKANEKAIGEARARISVIASRLAQGAYYLEKVNKDLEDALTSTEREKLERRKGRLEDAQQELPAESEDLHRYMDRLLDPEAAWPGEDEQMRRFLCAEERDKIARYCDPVLRAEAMPN